MRMPTDRGHLPTEQRNEDSSNLDVLSTRQCVDLMVQDHLRVHDAVAQAAGAIGGLIEALVPRMAAGGRLIYLGAGTSGRLGVLDASECPPTFQSDPEQVIGIIAGGDAALRRSSEAKEDDPDGAAEALSAIGITQNDTVVGIAAGGTTPYVIGGLDHAKRLGAMSAFITCTPTTVVSVDHLIVLNTGAELLTGSTRMKAGSATKLALNIISTTVFIRLGKVYGNLMVDLRVTNDKLLDRAIRILISICPELSRDAAQCLLLRAKGQLKAAIVMQRRAIDLNQAMDLLAMHRGSLRQILGEC